MVGDTSEGGRARCWASGVEPTARACSPAPVRLGLGQSRGVLADDIGGRHSGAMTVPGTSGLGQTICGAI